MTVAARQMTEKKTVGEGGQVSVWKNWEVGLSRTLWDLSGHKTVVFSARGTVPPFQCPRKWVCLRYSHPGSRDNIHQADRVRREARHAEVTIKNTEHNGMIYHVFTVELFTR